MTRAHAIVLVLFGLVSFLVLARLMYHAACGNEQHARRTETLLNFLFWAAFASLTFLI